MCSDEAAVMLMDQLKSSHQFANKEQSKINKMSNFCMEKT